MNFYLNKLLLEHPKKVNMTYTEHLNHSMSISRDMFIGSIKAAIHGLIPFFYEKSSTDLINKYNKILIYKKNTKITKEN